MFAISQHAIGPNNAHVSDHTCDLLLFRLHKMEHSFAELQQFVDGSRSVLLDQKHEDCQETLARCSQMSNETLRSKLRAMSESG
jgi:hypothetical protein